MIKPQKELEKILQEWNSEELANDPELPQKWHALGFMIKSRKELEEILQTWNSEKGLGLGSGQD